MTSAEFEIRLPPESWIARLSTTYPELSYRVLSVMSHDGEGTGLLEVRGDDVGGALEFVAGDEGPEGVSRLDPGGPDVAVLQFHTSEPTVFDAARSAGTPVQTPFEIEDGVVTLEVNAARDNVGELASRLDEEGLEYYITRVGDVEVGGDLTDRQVELVSLAREMGYYETPRRASLSDVADAAGVAKSTCSEVLHRAESTLVERFLESREDRNG